MNKINAGIFFGGVSTEHEVSRRSAVHVIKSIDRSRFDFTLFEISKDGGLFVYEDGISATEEFCRELSCVRNSLPKTRISYDSEMFRDRGIDVVFPVLHGTGGEDGVLQGFLELCGVPYVGAGVAGSAVSFDKVFTKEILKTCGIRQVRYLVVFPDTDMDRILDEAGTTLGYPIFVKPANGGSSVGIYKARDRQQLSRAIEKASGYDRKVILEEAVSGMELECAVAGGYEEVRALGVGMVIPCNEFYDYNAKYIDDASEVIVPAPIDDVTAAEIMDMAVKAFREVDGYGLARVDFFLNDEKGIFLNEINTMPGFTSISMFPKLWRFDGGSDSELISMLIDLAFERKEKYRFLKEYEPDEE